MATKANGRRGVRGRDQVASLGDCDALVQAVLTDYHTRAVVPLIMELRGRVEALEAASVPWWRKVLVKRPPDAKEVGP